MRISTIALTASILATAGVVGFGKSEYVMTGIEDRDTLPVAAIGPDEADAASASGPLPSILLAQAGSAPQDTVPVLPVTPAQLQNPPPRTTPLNAADAPAPATSAAGSAAQNRPVKVDESALRYFAAQGDTQRLQAEISRLRALYPGWVPPDNPLASAGSGDPQLDEMWQLYSQARYGDVRRLISERQATEPGWQPPADLTDRLRVAEQRMQLIGAFDRKNYEMVTTIAAEAPMLLTCSEVDILWRVAEAFGRSDRQSRSRDAYVYILENCDDAQERLATVQKAAEVLPALLIEDILSRERKGQDGTPEFETIRDDIARRFLAEADNDDKLVVDAKYIDRVKVLADTQKRAADALLLGWYYYRRADTGSAEQWFRRAFTTEETASAAQGLALTRIAMKNPAEAEAVMYRWRDSSEAAKNVYLAAAANFLAVDPPLVIDAAILQRMMPVVIDARDAAAGQQFGWYARVFGQPVTAADWFRLVLSWKPDDEPSAYGLALSLFDLGRRAEVAEIQRLWAGKSERIARLGEVEPARRARGAQASQPSSQQVSQQSPVVRYQQNLEMAAQPMASGVVAAPRIDQRNAGAMATTAPQQRTTRLRAQSTAVNCRNLSDPETLPPASALAAGWCLMDLNRPMEAAVAFGVALKGSGGQQRSDAAYGQSLAYLRAGLTEKAAVSAAKSPLNRARADELQVAILADRAVGAFRLGRFRETLVMLDQRAQIAPERKDLMSLRAYAYSNLGYTADAIRIFKALAATGDNAGIKGLAQALQASEPGG